MQTLQNRPSLCCKAALVGCSWYMLNYVDIRRFEGSMVTSRYLSNPRHACCMLLFLSGLGQAPVCATAFWIHRAEERLRGCVWRCDCLHYSTFFFKYFFRRTNWVSCDGVPVLTIHMCRWCLARATIVHLSVATMSMFNPCLASWSVLIRCYSCWFNFNPPPPHLMIRTFMIGSAYTWAGHVSHVRCSIDLFLGTG